MVSESIFSGKTVIVPMANVQHIEKHFKAIYNENSCIGHDKNVLEGILVITDKTKWNFENDTWENATWIGSTDNQAQEFIKAWCYYRYELEDKNNEND